ncbi:MAG: EAL domain-containing protein, partial [Rhizobiales bacterium]|nr:EAL domain-containing protein [Hyphomicrobiales bacterium]
THHFGQNGVELSDEIVIIEIDESSIQEYNQWPWPREKYAELLKILEASQPKMVAFTLDFSTASNPVSDHAFSNALKSSSFPIVLPTRLIEYNDSNINSIERLPIDIFSDYALLANANIMVGKSGHVAEYATFSKAKRPTIGALLSNKSFINKNPIIFDLYDSPGSIPRISFKDVISGKFDSTVLYGKNILIGTTASSLGEIYISHKHERLTNVEVHALGYQSIIKNDYHFQLPEYSIFIIAILLFLILAFLYNDNNLILALSINVALIVFFYLVYKLLHQMLFVNANITEIYIAILCSSILQIVQNIKYKSKVLFRVTNKNNFNKALINHVIKANENGIVITNLDGNILLANKKARQLFSINYLTLRNAEPVFDYIPDSKKLFEQMVNASTKQKTIFDTTTHKITNNNKQSFDVEISLNKTKFHQHFEIYKKSEIHEIYIFTIRDITEKLKVIKDKKLSEKALTLLENNDPLTKLPNRSSFNKHLDIIYSNKHIQNSFIVTLINLDSIQEINEDYSQRVGDECIFQVGLKLKSLLGHNTVISRFSDDIFGIIFNDIETENRSQILDFIHQIGDAFSDPLNVGDHEIIMSISMGVALAPKHGDTPEILTNNALHALNRAKNSDQDKWHIYEKSFAQEVRVKREIKAEIQRALENNEFVLFYQPQHDILTNRLLGYEALIRWEDPYKGLRFPDEFIPVAEETGLISQIGEYVLKLGCEDASTWPEHLTIAINVSTIQFQETNMATLCAKYLTLSGLKPEQLELEITESMLMDKIDDVIKTLTEIKDLGVKIAMDDFGTGYSSLQYLTELPFDKIKIDRSFTMNIGKSRQADALISTIVALGHSLDKVVLAEGIETEDMIILLRAAGCQIGQGYFYAKPMPIVEVNKQLELEVLLGETA